MKFSEHWLRTLVDPPIDSAELSERLTMAGLEVEERTTAAPAFTGVVVARVLEVERHPNADRLTVCKVDAGQGDPLTIVCGAPNAASGIAVPCALPGATLPGGLTIKRTTMRGVESQGMLCSAAELGLSDDASGLAILDPTLEHEPGTDLRVAFDLDDPVLTLKLTPNRADCLSVLGVAREVAAITGAPLKPPPSGPVEVETEAIRNVRVEDPKAPTPQWMKGRLERSGIRPISAVVDVTNYVMLKWGQPLHAYDDDELQGDIVVRFAHRDEKLTLLNGQTLALDPDMLLVADEKRPLGLAGIMGGEHSGISAATKNVFLEGAFWNPRVIQGKSRRLGFVTDAGYRFERGVDFGRCAAAVNRATQLIIELCGGVAGPLLDIQGALPSRDPVRVRTSRVKRLLGLDVPIEQIGGIFERLGLEPRREGDDFLCTAPSFRFDLAIEEDFVEEVARLYGYENIPAAPAREPQAMLPDPESLRPTMTLKSKLVDRDYQEVITFSFVSSDWERALGVEPNPVRVLNPIAANLDAMRSTLLGGLIDTLRTNANRKQERVRIFEVGRCFFRDGESYGQPLRVGALAAGPALPEQWGVPKRAVDFFDLKGDIEALAAPQAVTTEAAEHPALHPGRSARVRIAGEIAGWLGELHPRLVRHFELPAAPILFELDVAVLGLRPVPSARPVSKLPVVRRDLAVVVDEAISAQAVLDALVAVKPPFVDRLALFDVYRGPGIDPGKKSLAILVLMQDTARTLADAEIDAAVATLLRELQGRFKATLRR